MPWRSNDCGNDGQGLLVGTGSTNGIETARAVAETAQDWPMPGTGTTPSMPVQLPPMGNVRQQIAAQPLSGRVPAVSSKLVELVFGGAPASTWLEQRVWVGSSALHCHQSAEDTRTR